MTVVVGVRDVELEERLAGVCGELNAAHARLVEVVAEVVASAAWEGWGIHSPAQWVAWKTGLSPARAGEVVELARRRDELAVTFEAFGAGELAVDQVAAVAKRVPGWADAEACRLARSATVAQLRRSLSRYVFTPPLEPDRPGDPTVPVERFSVADAPTPVDRCSFGFDDAGRFWLHACGDADAGTVVEAALGEARDRLFHDGHPDVSWWDALVEVAHRSLDQVTDPARRDRFRVHVHVDVDGVTPARLTSGQVLPDSLRRRLVCDGVIIPVWERDGIAFAAGPAVKVIPERIRRAVAWRDGGCRVLGCTARRFLEVHHLVHREHGGATDTPNLVCLCPRHHRLHHQGRLGIEGNADDPDGLVFTNAAAQVLHPGPRPTPPTGPPPQPVRRYQHPTGEPLHSRWLSFNPPRSA